MWSRSVVGRNPVASMERFERVSGQSKRGNAFYHAVYTTGMPSTGGWTRVLTVVVVVVLLAGCSSVQFVDEFDEENGEIETDTSVEEAETSETDEEDDAGADGSGDGEGDADADGSGDGEHDHDGGDTDGDEAGGGEVDGDEADALDGPEVYEETVAELSDSEAAAFRAAVTDDDEFTDAAASLFEAMEAYGTTAERVAIAERVAAAGEVRAETVADVERLAASPPAVRSEITAVGVTDTSGDGLLDAEAAAFGVEPGEAHPEVAAIAEPLAADGYADVDVEFLQRVGEMTAYQGNEYEVWSQAEQLGLLHEATADGEVDEGDLWDIENDASNRLINGMEEEIGTDPERADTSGDGFDDHLKWGPLRDLGVEVNPAEIDVYVEMDQAQHAEQLERRQLSLISGTMSRETGDDMPRVNMHFEQCELRAEDVHTTDDLDQRYAEHHEAQGYGFHYFFVNNGMVEFEDELVPGVARSSTRGPSWVMADVDPDWSPSEQASLVAHEFGHAFGIYDTDFDGVDSREYSATEYNSVMNYNLDHTVTFSTGSPFDDYAEMQRNDFGQRFQSQHMLEGAWESGELPEEQPCGGF